MKQPCIHFLLVLFVVLSGCGEQSEAQATPLPTPTAVPQPTPSPALALGLRKQGIVFHDLSVSEQVCPGFVELLVPVEVSPESISDRSMEIVRQVRFLCTNDEKGTVYILDLANQTITVARMQPPVPGMP